MTAGEGIGRRLGPMLEVVADGRPGIGAGHLGRCLALVQAWIGGGGRARILDDPPRPTGWVERYRAAGAHPVGRAQPGQEADVVVVDGYSYEAETLAELRTTSRVVAIDDFAMAGPRPADIVVDQNLGADSDRYRPLIGDGPMVLAGPRYVLMREEVVGARPSTRPDRSVVPRRMLVAAGGDPSPAVSALFASVATAAAKRHGLEMVALSGVRDLGPVLGSGDLALSAAGTTVWELALFAVPTIVVAVADNQQRVARSVGGARVAVDAGDLAEVDDVSLGAAIDSLVASAEQREVLASNAWALVDGRGAQRVAAAVRASLLTLRRAGPDDAELLWTWANDPEVRGSSFDPQPIPWDDHVAWLGRVLATADEGIWIASDSLGRLIGQVRVDGAATGTGTIGVSVAAERRGEGWAAPLLVAASQRAQSELGGHGLQRLRADVLPANLRSARAFIAADFDRGPDASRDGQPHQTYTRLRHG